MIIAKSILIALFIMGVLYKAHIISKMPVKAKEDSIAVFIAIMALIIHVITVAICYNLLGVFSILGV